jgi:septal ring factor EnvC (AmiA/AmiB activator)
LPTSGGIRAQFGSARGGGLRWNGIVIAAASGAPVKAVKSGKVLYADFLRGYGKLVIVDHGRGFMSLYGYNQSLQVSVGDNVSAGQTLASVGAGTGDTESGLYFETRLRGRPSQPGNWCNY